MKYLPLYLFATLLLVIGCGGGGSGGGTTGLTNGGNNGTNNNGGNNGTNNNGGNNGTNNNGGNNGSNNGGNNGSTAGVAGRIVEEGTTVGVQGVIIRFYTAAGTQSGQATTDTTGNYTTTVDPASTLLQVISTSIPLGYHKSYTYNRKRYVPSDNTCRAPLPTLGSGTTAIPNIAIPSASNPPPPPPTGCQ